MSQDILLPPGAETDAASIAAAPDSVKIKPAMVIVWNPAMQAVDVQVDADQVKTWEFAHALLDMAEQRVERIQKVQQIQQMAAAQEQAQAAQAVAQQAARSVSRQIQTGRR